MFRLHSTNRFVASILLMTVPIIGYSAPASAYGRATIFNRTNYVVHGTIHYAGCRGDNFTVAAGKVGANSVIAETQSTISAYRGACLITRITATVNGKAASAYTSSGTGYERFIVAASNTGYKVDSLANMQKEVADATGGPGFRIINNTNWPVEVSLDQVSCLYYGVAPAGQAFDRNTGAVWFTISAQQQLDTIEHKTLSSCVLPVAAIVGGIILSALTAGVGAAIAAPAAGAAAAAAAVATSTTVTVGSAALVAGAKAAAVAGAKETIGAALVSNGQGELKGQYAGPPWPFRCSVKPTYTITGGWGKTTKDVDGNVVIPLGTALKITKTNTCGNSMMN